MVEKDNKHTLIILTMFALQRVGKVMPLNTTVTL